MVDYIGKVEYDSKSEIEMEREFRLLKQSGARIILSYSMTPPSFACWFHKTGIFGPRYVIFELAWTVMDITAIEMPEHWPWCTMEMVQEVAQTIIMFGDGFYSDANNDGTPLDEMLNFIRGRVNETEGFVKPYWSALFYDKAFAAGLILNETERILKLERNETLSDWLTNGYFFNERGQDIAEIIKKASLNLEMTGFKGVYGFKNEGGAIVSNSFFPVFFSQYVLINKTDLIGLEYEQINIAYHSTDDMSILNHLQPIHWRTFDGKPPKDSLLLINLKLPMIPISLNIVFILIAIVSTVPIFPILFYIIKGKRNTLEGGNKFAILLLSCGNALMISHVLMIPLGVELDDVLVNGLCSSIVYVTSIGASLVICGIFSVFYNSEKWKRFVSFWIIFDIAILTIAIGLAQLPLSGQVNLIEWNFEYVPNTDFTQAIQSWRWTCIAIGRVFTDPVDYSIMPLVSVSAFGNAILLLFSVMNAFKMTSKKYKVKKPKKRFRMANGRLTGPSRRKLHKNQREFANLKRAAYCTYCQLSIVVAACFISVIQKNNSQSLFILLALFCFTVAILNISFIIIPQLIQWRHQSRRIRVHYGIVLYSTRYGYTFNIPTYQLNENKPSTSA